jgi:hypothetical protein
MFHVHHHHGKLVRGGIYAIMGVIALVFALAAIGTDLARWGGVEGHDNTNFKSTVWEICGRGFHDDHIGTCYRTTDHNLGCDEMRDHYNALQAFYVLTNITLLIAIVFAILDHGNVRGFKHYKKILTGLSFLTVAFSVLGWSIAIATVRKDFCDGSHGEYTWGAMQDQPNFEWGASPFLLIVTTVLGIMMLCVAHKAPHDATETLEPEVGL